MKEDDDRLPLVQHVRQWGDVNTDAILDPKCQIFKIPSIEGVIGYQVDSGHAVAFGDPVCSLEDKLALADAFQQHCKSQDLKVIYAMTSKSFTEQVVPRLCQVSVEFGKKLILDPENNPIHKTGSKSVLVRKKVKHATQEGTMIKEYLTNDPKLEAAIEQVSLTWLKARKGPQIHLGHVRLFEDRLGKRWFYAEKEGRVMAFLLLNQLKNQSSWLLNNLMMLPDASHGTSELLVISTLETLEKEKGGLINYGPVPAPQLGEIIGLGPFSTWFTRNSFKLARRIFRLDGHGIFWEKFQPTSQQYYLLFDQKSIRLKTMMSLMHALNVTT